VVLSNAFVAAGLTPPVGLNDQPGSVVTVSPGTIANMLNDGMRVLLEATNDIIVRKAIVATGTTNDDGSLELRAGRHITLNASVTNLNQDDGGISFIASANRSSFNPSSLLRDSGDGAITAAPGVVITTRGGVDLSAASIGTATTPISINTSANASVSALTTLGDLFLRQLGGPTQLSLLHLDAPTNRLIQFDSADQALIIDTAINVENGANLHLIAGSAGLDIRSGIASNGNITLESTNGTIRVSSVDVSTSNGSLLIKGGALEVFSTNARTVITGSSETRLEIAGNVIIRGSSSTAATSTDTTLGSVMALCTGSIGGDLTLIGGSAPSASATLFGGPDVGSRASPLQVGGVITMTSGSGQGSVARIHAASPSTIFVNFPNATSGGYTVDGQAVTSLGDSGFFANGLPAVLGQNLFITYGRSTLSPSMNTVVADIENANRNRWLAKVDNSNDPVLPQCR
jgi:hypothetical protein